MTCYTKFFTDTMVGASHGIADIHEHFDMNTDDIANGEIKNYMTGKVYYSKTGLSSMEVMDVANQAKSVAYLDGYVNWMTTALKLAKQEKQNKKFISTIK